MLLQTSSTPSWASLCQAFLGRDIRKGLNNPAVFLTSLFFFLAILALMPFVMDAQTTLLQQASAGIVWLAGILSALLSLDRLIKDDAEHGFLDWVTGLGLPMELFFLTKACGQWISCVLPLAVLSPVGGLLMGVSFQQTAVITTGFMVGSVCVSLLGAMGAVFALGSRSAALLVPLLILPLLIPVLIFGTGLAKTTWLSPEFYNLLLVLCGLDLLFLVITSVISGILLRLFVREG